FQVRDPNVLWIDEQSPADNRHSCAFPQCPPGHLLPEAHWSTVPKGFPHRSGPTLAKPVAMKRLRCPLFELYASGPAGTRNTANRNEKRPKTVFSRAASYLPQSVSNKSLQLPLCKRVLDSSTNSQTGKGVRWHVTTTTRRVV